MIDVNISQHPLGCVEIWITDNYPEKNKYYVAEEINFKFVEREPNKICDPTIKLDMKIGSHFLQQLSTKLIQAGFKDKKIDSTYEIKRIENHLEDMRKIVFKEKYQSLK